MAHDPTRGRSPYRSPDVVLAEAQRIAADIRRRAERDANVIRREAAEWATATRQEADRHRERVLAELEHARAVAELRDHASGPDDAGDPALPEPAPLIDLRTPGDTRPVRLVIVPAAEDDDPPSDPLVGAGDPSHDDGDDPEAAEVQHRPAVGGTYVVGHRLPPPGVSIESKVHDVVRLAVRRTFNRRIP